MQTRYPKRLIEVDLPIARISANARAEKDSRVGHIPRLHIYPAARPVAACRAITCAALWPDPVDLQSFLDQDEECSIIPVRFLDEAKRLMLRRSRKHLKKVSNESYSNLISIQKTPKKLNDAEILRELLLDFIADFASWENSKDSEYIEIAQSLTLAAHEALEGEQGTRPLLFDPFAGGGAIPLEGLRSGCEVFASDLNPISVAINKVILEYIPRYGDILYDEIERFTAWAKERAVSRLKNFYPSDS